MSTDKEKINYLLENLKLKIMIVTPFYGGSFPTSKHTTNAFKNIGHDVCEFDSSDFYDGFSKIQKVTPNEEDTAVLMTSYTNLIGEAILSKAKEFKPDIIVALAQAPLTADVLKRLRLMNIVTAFWFVEDFRVLPYWEKVAPFYDYFFAIQKGEFFERLKNAGAKNIYYLPQAANLSEHKKVTLTEDDKAEYCSDISTISAAYYNRQRFFNGLIDFDFKIWGNNWDILSPCWKNVQRNGARIETSECVKIFNATKVNINLHSSSYQEGVNPDGDFVNPRTFELASCGSFQLVDERAYLSESFNVGDEIITFSNIQDLREKIKFYIDNPKERKRVSENAYKRAQGDHTFEKRAEEILTVIFENECNRFLELSKRENYVSGLINDAGEDTELGIYLSRFRGKSDLSLLDVIIDIENGAGSLTKPEVIFLMMNQFLTEKK